MKIIVNGQAHDVDNNLSLHNFLKSLGVESAFVAVELNRNILSQKEIGTVELKNGDILEIVKFVGGG